MNFENISFGNIFDTVMKLRGLIFGNNERVCSSILSRSTPIMQDNTPIKKANKISATNLVSKKNQKIRKGNNCSSKNENKFANTIKINSKRDADIDTCLFEPVNKKIDVGKVKNLEENKSSINKEEKKKRVSTKPSIKRITCISPVVTRVTRASVSHNVLLNSMNGNLIMIHPNL